MFFFYHLINSAQISRAFIHRIALTRLVLVVSINFKMKDKKDHWLQSAQKNIKLLQRDTKSKSHAIISRQKDSKKTQKRQKK